MIPVAVLAALPWIAVGGVVMFGIREPLALPPAPEGTEHGGSQGLAEPSPAPAAGLPSVRIVVPARNESRNIETCVRSLAGQDYPDFGIVVVDDRSTDDTGTLAAGVPAGRSRGVEVIFGAALPVGWLGKPWACAQGAKGAEEALLLFTDADTVHEPLLLRRAVAALQAEGAEALSLLGRQELGSFWERLLQPQVFTMLGLRYRRLDMPLERGQEAAAIANGQYILLRRETYEAVGGHESVRTEVVEDLRLAQRLIAGGHRLILRSARDVFATRMYQSLREIVDGWTKNLAVGARQAGGWWGRVALPAIVAYSLVVWVLPPLVLLAGAVVRLAGGGFVPLPGAVASPSVHLWAGVATGVGVLTWADTYRRRFAVSPAYALLYPLGAAVTALIAVRSGWRGERRIEWKGRRYSGGHEHGESG